jgi:hypothetical protein
VQSPVQQGRAQKQVLSELLLEPGPNPDAAGLEGQGEPFIVENENIFEEEKANCKTGGFYIYLHFPFRDNNTRSTFLFGN